MAPAGFGAGSAPPIPSPFNLSGLIFYQTRDPDGFGSPTGTHHGSDAGACGEEYDGILGWGWWEWTRVCVCCLQDSRFHRVHVICGWCGSHLVDVWLGIGLLGIGLGLRAGLRVCGYGFATPKPAPSDLAGLTFHQTLPI